MAMRDLIPWKRERTPARLEVEQDPFLSFRREMDRMFDDFWTGSRSLSPWGEAWTGFDPKVDVTETDTEVKVAAELPGLQAEDVQLSVSHNVLSIKGEKRQEHEEKGKNWYRSERSYGAFERAIPLPQGTDSEHVDAAFDKGVLTVIFAKTQEGKPARITVKTQ